MSRQSVAIVCLLCATAGWLVGRAGTPGKPERCGNGGAADGVRLPVVVQYPDPSTPDRARSANLTVRRYVAPGQAPVHLAPGPDEPEAWEWVIDLAGTSYTLTPVTR